MPELTWKFGYPFALVLMALAALFPFLYFKRKGWLEKSAVFRHCIFIPLTSTLIALIKTADFTFTAAIAVINQPCCLLLSSRIAFVGQLCIQLSHACPCCCKHSAKKCGLAPVSALNAGYNAFVGTSLCTESAKSQAA